MTNLLPCPFCGDAAHLSQRETDGNKWGAIVCGCGATGPDVRTGYAKNQEVWYEDAAEAWNNRAALTPHTEDK